MKELTKILKALSDLNRLRIVAVLHVREACVCELAWALGIQQSNLSRHLRVLENAGLVVAERVGNWMIYRLDLQPDVKDYVEAIIRNASSDAQVRKDIARIKKADRAEICRAKE
jgi:ArsR family transcriptional regulator, arsenate/arsenite/antimonite-responsive transcriptional repressor